MPNVAIEVRHRQIRFRVLLTTLLYSNKRTRRAFLSPKNRGPQAPVCLCIVRVVTGVVVIPGAVEARSLRDRRDGPNLPAISVRRRRRNGGSGPKRAAASKRPCYCCCFLPKCAPVERARSSAKSLHFVYSGRNLGKSTFQPTYGIQHQPHRSPPASLYISRTAHLFRTRKTRVAYVGSPRIEFHRLSFRCCVVRF